MSIDEIKRQIDRINQKDGFIVKALVMNLKLKDSFLLKVM